MILPSLFVRTRVGVSHDSWCLVYQCATGSLVSNGAGGGKPDVCSIRRMIDRQVGQRWNKKGACWYLRYQHHVNAECACIFPATLLYCQCTGNDEEGSGAEGVSLDAKLPEWAGFVCCTLFTVQLRKKKYCITDKRFTANSREALFLCKERRKLW